MSKRPHIVAIKVDYTLDYKEQAARYEPEQSLYWVARLNENKPSSEYAVSSVRSTYSDDQGHPLYFVRITHTPTQKILYVRQCTIIESR